MKPRFNDPYSLYTDAGLRKYLNRDERRRFLTKLRTLPQSEQLLILTIAWSGARVSEVLALTPSSFQLPTSVVAIRTLKRRMHHVREVPMPRNVIAQLDRHFSLAAAQRDPQRASCRLWSLSRTTAWRLVKRIMAAAGIVGAHACPKGLRHAFGIATLGVVPKNVRQKWMGHARPETTDIYSAVCGPDELAFARQFWRHAT